MRAAVLLPLIAVPALVLAGCGEAPAAPAPPATSRPPSARTAAAKTCGKVSAVTVVVRAGAVDCAQATQVLTRYFHDASPAAASSPDAAPVAVGDWTCGSGSTPSPWTSCSTEDGREVDGVSP